MVEFPDEIIENILSRLPVKPVIRYKCVSKRWFALIDSDSFMKQHLNQSLETKTNHTLILHQYHLHSIYSINLYSISSQALQLALPIVSRTQPVIKLLGSCNGLLCLSVGEVIVIWNPTIRKHVKLPAISLENPLTNDGAENVDIVYGFGYDSGTDDYKVVMLVQFFEAGDYKYFQSEANVYSLRLDLWRKVWGFPNYYISSKQARSVLACGALHWFVIIEGESEFELDSLVASFDLVTEECGMITQPNFADHDGESSLLLSEFDSCLSILCNYYEVGVVDMWVMKDYEVKSWSKLFTLGSEMIRSWEHLIPLAYSESGDEVLLTVNFEKLLWYNPKERTTKVVDVRGLPKPCYPVVCLESLVSLGERAENDEKQSGENEGAKEDREEKDKFLSVGFKLVL